MRFSDVAQPETVRTLAGHTVSRKVYDLARTIWALKLTGVELADLRSYIDDSINMRRGDDDSDR